jgi:DNA segregation ATPase FtsK/SpoIIIE-like protein
VEFLKEHYPAKYQFDNSNKTQSNENESVIEAYPDSEEENKYQAIKEWAQNKEFVSISLIQRECAIGFNRASRYFIRLQQEGVLSKETTNKGNKVVN